MSSSPLEDQTHMYLTASWTTPPCGHRAGSVRLKDYSDHMISLSHGGTAGLPQGGAGEA